MDSTPPKELDAEFMAALEAALNPQNSERVSRRGAGNPEGGPGRAPGSGRYPEGTSPNEYRDERGNYDLSNLTHAHEALMNWMIANPHRPLKDAAVLFNFSPAWLYRLVHTDLFQARLREKQDIVFGRILGDVTEQLTGIAGAGLAKLEEHLETSENPKFIFETTKMALEKLGFGNKPTAPAIGVQAQNVQQNFYVASREDLLAARSVMQESGTVSSAASPAEQPELATPEQQQLLPTPGLGGPKQQEPLTLPPQQLQGDSNE